MQLCYFLGRTRLDRSTPSCRPPAPPISAFRLGSFTASVLRYDRPIDYLFLLDEFIHTMRSSVPSGIVPACRLVISRLYLTAPPARAIFSISMPHKSACGVCCSLHTYERREGGVRGRCIPDAEFKCRALLLLVDLLPCCFKYRSLRVDAEVIVEVDAYALAVVEAQAEQALLAPGQGGWVANSVFLITCNPTQIEMPHGCYGVGIQQETRAVPQA